MRERQNEDRATCNSAEEVATERATGTKTLKERTSVGKLKLKAKAEEVKRKIQIEKLW